MRREYMNHQSPLPPFVEDLVFWAPLTEDDMTDNISHAQGQSLGAGQISWSSSEGAYLLTTNNGTSLSFYLPDFALLIPNSYTIYAKIKVAVASTAFYLLSSGTYGNNANTNYPIVGTHNFGIASDVGNWHTLVAVFNKDTLTQYDYVDGVLHNSYSRPANNTIWSSNWPSGRKNNISLGSYYYYNGTAYEKDVRIYNRTFTASEVAQL